MSGNVHLAIISIGELFFSLSLARTHSTVYFPTMRYIEPLHKISTTAITTTADATTEIQFWKHTIRHTHKKRRSKYSRSIIHQTKLNVCTLFAHSKFLLRLISVAVCLFYKVFATRYPGCC